MAETSGTVLETEVCRHVLILVLGPVEKIEYGTAVVIVPPKKLWDQIQAVRKEHDKAYTMSMPRINL